eukprot:Skav229024  [mRNA]  locus=scaffold127:586912:591124:- [translate_table: standard]
MAVEAGHHRLMVLVQNVILVVSPGRSEETGQPQACLSFRKGLQLELPGRQGIQDQDHEAGSKASGTFRALASGEDLSPLHSLHCHYTMVHRLMHRLSHSAWELCACNVSCFACVKAKPPKQKKPDTGNHGSVRVQKQEGSSWIRRKLAKLLRDILNNGHQAQFDAGRGAGSLTLIHVAVLSPFRRCKATAHENLLISHDTVRTASVSHFLLLLVRWLCRGQLAAACGKRGSENLGTVAEVILGDVVSMTTSSVSSLCDAYRADAAELAKFLDQLCLTLQHGKELQKRFAEAVDRLEAAHKADKAEAELDGKSQKVTEVPKEVPKEETKNRKNGDAADVTETARPTVDVSDAAADTTDTTTPLTSSRATPDSSNEEPPPPPPPSSKAPPPGLRSGATPVKAKPEPKPAGEAPSKAQPPSLTKAPPPVMSKAPPPSINATQSTPVKAPPPQIEKSGKSEKAGGDMPAQKAPPPNIAGGDMPAQKAPPPNISGKVKAAPPQLKSENNEVANF